MTGTQPEFVTLARALTLDAFVAQHPGWYLLGDDTLVRPMGPTRTVGPGEMNAADPAFFAPLIAALDESTEEIAASLLVLPVRKQKDVPTPMVTLGRTANNDVVVADISVSKFHAFFRIDDHRVELTDARSRNGTWLGLRRLVPQVPALLTSGAQLSFGRKAFQFFSAGDLWQRLRSEQA